jgi:hypothetical protein
MNDAPDDNDNLLGTQVCPKMLQAPLRTVPDITMQQQNDLELLEFGNAVLPCCTCNGSCRLPMLEQERPFIVV